MTIEQRVCARCLPARPRPCKAGETPSAFPQWHKNTRPVSEKNPCFSNNSVKRAHGKLGGTEQRERVRLGGRHPCSLIAPAEVRMSPGCDPRGSQAHQRMLSWARLELTWGPDCPRTSGRDLTGSRVFTKGIKLRRGRQGRS